MKRERKVSRDKLKWVPISYCQFLIENGCVNAGKLHVYLKYESNGIFPYKEALRKSSQYYDVSERTIRRWLSQARRYNMIGKNTDDNLLFVRGWQYFFNQYKFPKKASYRFKKKDLKDFKTYCYAAVISYMATRAQARETERSRRSDKYVRSYQAPAWVPMASKAISKTMRVPISTARFYRNKAVDAGYIEKKPNLQHCNIHTSNLKRYKKYGRGSGAKLIVRGGRVYKQLPDLVKVESKNIHSPKRFHLKKTM